MSSIPGAPLPHDGPPTPPSNPWTLFAVVAGGGAVLAGFITLLVGATTLNRFGATVVPVVIGTAVLALGVLLLCCALVLAGFDWYLRHRR